MKDQLKILVQLQACDSRISTINDQKNKAPLRIQELQEDLTAAGERFREDSERLELLRQERRQIEQEIQDFDSRMEKSNTKLSNIKSNKEYAAVLKEIEDIKSTKFRTEDKMIQLLEEIEALEQKKIANKEEQDRLKAEFNAGKHEIEKEIGQLDQELNGLQKKNKGLCRTINDDILKKYHFLRERKGGQAVSSVIAGVCQACHMGIPPQKFNELLRGDALMTCPYCNRMIYWGEDEHFQETRKDV